MNTNILKSALISEKSFVSATNGKFTFIIDKKATKEDAKLAIEAIFNVNVVDINTVSVRGKIKRTKTGFGRRSDYKKAIVKLQKGQKIDLFESEEKKEDKKVAKEAKK